VALRLAKRFNMDRQALKELMYGGIAELMRNRHYYYYSSVGVDYCHWTEEGQKALADYMNIIGWKMLESAEAELTQKAKDMTINALKGNIV
jgi:hypothetical protein